MDEYLAFATQLAYDAGKIMLEHFQIGVPSELKLQEGNTPVTIADKQINALVVEMVRKNYPSHAVRGEEQSLDVADAVYTWVCDPIDGTIPYSAGVPTNVFSLALVDGSDGKPVIAVVYDPYMKRLYHAVKGKGAYVNETQLHVNNTVALEEAIVGTSSRRSKVVDSDVLKAEIMVGCFRQLSLNSTIYEAMLVASGQLAAQVFVGNGAHDVASAKLIVEEAGGRGTDIFGDEQRYDKDVRGSILSNSRIHDELVKMTRANKL